MVGVFGLGTVEATEQCLSKDDSAAPQAGQSSSFLSRLENGKAGPEVVVEGVGVVVRAGVKPDAVDAPAPRTLWQPATSKQA